MGFLGVFVFCCVLFFFQSLFLEYMLKYKKKVCIIWISARRSKVISAGRLRYLCKDLVV